MAIKRQKLIDGCVNLPSPQQTLPTRAEAKAAEVAAKVAAKAAEAKAAEAKAAEAKVAAKAAEAKAAEAKAAEAKAAEAKAAEAKAAEAKAAEAKAAEAKVAEAKVAEAKVAEAKVAEAKVAEAKAAEAKVAEAKAAEAKAAEAKVAEAKAAEAEAAEAKAAAIVAEAKVAAEAKAAVEARKNELMPVVWQLNSLNTAKNKLKDSKAKEAASIILLGVYKRVLQYEKDGNLAAFKTNCQTILSIDNSLVKKLNNYVDVKRVLLNLAALIFTLGIAHVALSASKGRLSFFGAPQAAGAVDKLSKSIENIDAPKPS